MESYGRYQIVGELGKGSMGVVYKAYDPQIDRTIALKVLRPDRVTSKAFVERFLKEARAIGRLSHPNIVTVYDIGQDHGTVFIAMEMLEGLALSDIIRQGSVPILKIIDIVTQVANALDYAHQRGIVHRDIKPSNIIIDSAHCVKLTDFGIAHIEDPNMPSQTQAGEILGTPAYMSPEQVLGRPVQGSADIFSLGIIMYEMVSGDRPFKGENLSAIFHAITSYNPEPPHKLNPEVPKELSQLILKCLAKDPDKRFKTASELANALEQIKIKILNPNIPPSKINFLHQKWLIGAGLFLLLGAVAGGYLFFNKLNISPLTTTKTQIKATSILDVNSVPPAAKVFIDGKFMGLTPVALKLASGPHHIKLARNGFYAWEAQVNLKDKVTTPLKITLISEDNR